MATSVQSRWVVRLATLLLWLLAAGSCVYWGLRLAVRAAPAAVAAPLRQPFAADPAAVARLLGASAVVASGPAQPAVSLSSRFNLMGVVAAQSHRGAALISVDGKPARPYRVGSAIDEGLVLQSVEGRRAVLAAGAGGPPVLTLELPPIKR
jgi:general secretion pathway protein C